MKNKFNWKGLLLEIARLLIASLAGWTAGGTTL